MVGKWFMGVFALLLLCAVCAVGVEGSKAYRAHYEQNVHDELSLLLHGVLSRRMSPSDVEHTMEVISSRVKEWRREQGLNTDDDEELGGQDSTSAQEETGQDLSIAEEHGETGQDLNIAEEHGEHELWEPFATYFPYILWIVSVLLGTVLYFRGYVVIAAPVGPEHAPNAPPAIAERPQGHIEEGDGNEEMRGGNEEMRGGGERDTKGEEGDEDRQEMDVDGIDEDVASVDEEQRGEGAAEATVRPRDADGRSSDVTLATHREAVGGLERTNADLERVITTRMEALETRDDEEAQKELAQFALDLLKLRQAVEQTVHHNRMASATERSANTSQEAYENQKRREDDEELAVWYKRAATTLWVLIVVWLAFEIYYRGLMVPDAVIRPYWVRFLPSALADAFVWLKSVASALQVIFVCVILITPIVWVLLGQTSYLIIPYYVLCGVFCWYHLESHEKARMVYCLLRPGIYACVLALCYGLCFWIIRLRKVRPRDQWYLLWPVLVLAYGVAMFLGVWIASSDYNLPSWEDWLLQHWFDDLYLWLVHN